MSCPETPELIFAQLCSFSLQLSATTFSSLSLENSGLYAPPPIPHASDSQRRDSAPARPAIDVPNQWRLHLGQRSGQGLGGEKRFARTTA